MQMAGKGATRITMRRATRDDVDLIATMHAESWANTYRGALPDDYLDRGVLDERAAAWKANADDIDKGERTVVIAELGGAPVGFVCILPPDDDRSVHVDNLHALPAFKGAGIGTALLKHAREWAVARGATSLNLLVMDSNTAAIGFYQSQGWVAAGSVLDTMGGVPIVALRYRLSFS
jgi:ribosomal protein S18 acetylase RimI-like enzyme